MQQQTIPLKINQFPKPTFSLHKTARPLTISLARKRKPRSGSRRIPISLLKATAFIISTLRILPQPLDSALEAAIGGNNNNGGSGLFKAGGFGDWWGGGKRRKGKTGFFKVVLFCVFVCVVFGLKIREQEAMLVLGFVWCCLFKGWVFGVCLCGDLLLGIGGTRSELKKLVGKLGGFRTRSPVLEFVEKSKKVLKANLRY